MKLHWRSHQKIWMYEDLGSLGNRILQRGIADGLRELGREVRLCPARHTDPNVKEALREDLLGFEPDLIVLTNHPLAHLLRQIGLESVDCPALVWLFDDPALMGDEPFADHEIALAADPGFIEGAQKRGAKTVYFAPVAAPVSPAPPPAENYRHPVVYAGSISIDQAFRKQIPAASAQQMRRMIKAKVDSPGESFQALFDSLNLLDGMKADLPQVASMRVTLNRRLLYFLYRESNMQYRLRYLKALAHLGLHVYGNAAWKTLLGKTLSSGRIHASIDPFDDYPRLAVSAAVNINLPSLQGFSAPVLREFQIPYWGGFLFSSRFTPKRVDWSAHDASGRFMLDGFPWPDSAETPGQLAELAEAYLNDEAKRRDWIEHASKTIRENHSMPRRLEQIGDMLETE